MVVVETATGELLDFELRRTNGHRAAFSIYLSVDAAKAAADRAFAELQREDLMFVIFDHRGESVEISRPPLA